MEDGDLSCSYLLEDCLVWQLDSTDVTGDGLLSRTGGAPGTWDLSDLGEVEDLALCRPVLGAVVLHKAVDLKTLHVSQHLRALRTLQTVSRLLQHKYQNIAPTSSSAVLTVSESVEGSS